MKLFVCAAEQVNTLLGGEVPTFLAQLIVLSSDPRAVSVVLKTDATSPDAAKKFVDVLFQALTPFGPQ